MRVHTISNYFFVFQAILLIAINSCHAGTNKKYENYKLIMSNNDKICRHMGKMFDDDVSRYGQVKYGNHEEFNIIKWNNGSYSYTDKDYNLIKRKAVLFSKFDINNDGIEETIAKEDKYLFGWFGDQILVVDDNRYDFSLSPDLPIKVRAKLPGIKLSGKWPYTLDVRKFIKKYQTDDYYVRNNILTFLTIYPFIFNDVLYLSMKENRRKKDKVLWHVIVKYTDKYFTIKNTSMISNKIEPICYFEHK